MPKCSVIIPNYNHAAYLEQRINSVLNQTFQDFEIIILDDFSNDNSLNIINSYKNNEKISCIITNNINSGSPFKQWKKGLELAKGDWIWFAETDDYAETDFLETAFGAINKCKNAGIFYSDTNYNTDDGSPYRFPNSSSFKNDYFKNNKWSLDYCNSGVDEVNGFLKYFCTIVNASCTLFKKDEIMQHSNKIPTFRYYGDWYSQICIALNSNICYSSKKLNTCRMHENNFLNNIDKIKSKKEYFIILNTLIKSPKIESKNKLIYFFSIQYIGFGLVKDGMKHAVSIFRNYYSINKKLTVKVFFIILYQKFTFQKRKTIY